jgi:predicted enzyme related to lactoylglutathione lyase
MNSFFKATLALSLVASCMFVRPSAVRAADVDFSVGAQYDTTHVYVAPADFDRFVASLVSTFGGKSSTKGTFTVTPTSSSTMSQLALTPSGTMSVFGFVTPIPFPFGAEHVGYLVSDFDAAVKAARAAGASLIVAPFPDPIGRDALVQWPGGYVMQIYWHTTAPHYDALQIVPENRVYLPSDAADAFVKDWLAFSHGKVVSDDRSASGAEVGKPGTTYRRIRIESGYGRIAVIATDGILPFPYGRELTGYGVADLDQTLSKAQAAGGTVVVPAFVSGGRRSAMVQFPGGYVAEIHSIVSGQ